MNQEKFGRLSIREMEIHSMREDAQQRLPEEACGIIAGKEGLSDRIYVVTNDEHSPRRYRMNPKEQIAAFLEMEALGLEMLAIYHSHPDGPEAPSETDLAEYAYPGVLMLILYPDGGDWNCRAYSIDRGTVTEVGSWYSTAE
jgi:proteasome lid subunit RPN8/RPN11